MSTTLQSHGGGAQPASIDTSGKVAGGTALRVYGFDTPEAAHAAGYMCEGGPAMSVALITDAQIAAGAWKAEGDPSATIIYTAPSGTPVEGGYAVPVYAVNGWGSTPAPLPDPIGDTLRADAVAYWKMDETSGTRIDATGRGNSLSISAGTVGYEAGKLSNAAHFVSGYLSHATNADLVVGDRTFSMWGWFKVDLFDGNRYLFYKGDTISVEEFGVFVNAANAIGFWMTGGDASYGVATAAGLNTGTWYFLHIIHDADASTVALCINNGHVDVEPVVPGTAATIYDFFCGSLDTLQFLGSLDEWGRVNRVLIQDEIDYLYNSGAGRALFPAP